jgi:hypothetical protein
MKDDDEKDTPSKSNNFLRQTMSSKSNFRPKLEKGYNDTYGHSYSTSFDSNINNNFQDTGHDQKDRYRPERIIV